MAIEDDYRSYRGAIAGGIEVLRPHFEVATVGLEAFEEELARFDPHLVISTLPATAGSGKRMAWVELSLDPLRPSVFCVGERRSEQRNPALDALIVMIDEVEELVKRNDDPGNCQGMGG